MDFLFSIFLLVQLSEGMFTNWKDEAKVLTISNKNKKTYFYEKDLRIEEPERLAKMTPILALQNYFSKRKA